MPPSSANADHHNIAYPARLSLARTPTPMEPLPRLGATLDVELLVKRDDLTGAELTGNGNLLLLHARRGLRSQVFPWEIKKRLSENNGFPKKYAGSGPAN